eukprot:5792504-Pleurochrysis_carterae.AAC.1
MCRGHACVRKCRRAKGRVGAFNRFQQLTCRGAMGASSRRAPCVESSVSACVSPPPNTHTHTHPFPPEHTSPPPTSPHRPFNTPHQSHLPTRLLVHVNHAHGGMGASVPIELWIPGHGFIGAEAISSRKLVDNHYYAIASKATLAKPIELNPPKGKLAEFTA